MNKIDFGLPQAVVVKGAIYDTMDPQYLREELLEIDLPDGLTISVGWEPHCDPSGSFRIVLFKDYWTDNRIEYRAKDLAEAIDTIRWLAVATYVDWNFILPPQWHAHVEFSALAMSPHVERMDSTQVVIELLDGFVVKVDWVQKLSRYVVTLLSGGIDNSTYVAAETCKDHIEVIHVVKAFGNRAQSRSSEDLTTDSAAGQTFEWRPAQSNSQCAVATR